MDNTPCAHVSDIKYKYLTECIANRHANIIHYSKYKRKQHMQFLYQIGNYANVKRHASSGKKVPKIKDLPCNDVFTINPVNQQWGPRARRQLAEDK